MSLPCHLNHKGNILIMSQLGERYEKENVHMTEVYQSATDKTDRTFGRHYNTGRL